MPSDCQCSTACACETKIIKEVLNNKEATRKLRRLEKEVRELREENRSLERRLKKANVNKRNLIKNLKNHLDRV